MSGRYLAAVCLLTFSVALGVRLLHWQNNWLTLDRTMFRLTAQYKEEAQLLLDGDIRSFVRGSSPQPDTGLLTHPPGYPVLITLIYKLCGQSDAWVRLFQILCDAGASVLLLLTAARLLPVGAALIASLLVALSPQLSYNSLLILPDSVSAFFILLAVYFIVLAARRPKITVVMAAGAAVGVSCWLRANALLLAPFLCLTSPVLFERGTRLRYSLAITGAAFLIISPVTIRNLIVFRSFVPLSLNAGLNLVEGIADYDAGGRFGLKAADDAVLRQEAELYNRPDYAQHLFRPDGVERERDRFARGLAVIRANKIWFLGVMLRRAGSMLTYEQVPIVSAEPSVTHSLDITNDTELAWSGSPTELAAGIRPVSPGASISLSEDNQLLEITCDDSGRGEQLTTAPINILGKSDYVLRAPVKMGRGRVVIKIKSTGSGRTLASATVPDSIEPADFSRGTPTLLQVPFVSGDANQVRVVFENAGANQARPVMRIGGMELFRLGPASFLYTRHPRWLVKGAQKFFRTNWLLPLTLIGIVLLACARRWPVLAVSLVVPAYYLTMHSPLHVEYRYILAMQYFFLTMAGVALYWAVIRFWQLIGAIRQKFLG